MAVSPKISSLEYPQVYSVSLERVNSKKSASKKEETVSCPNAEVKHDRVRAKEKKMGFNVFFNVLVLVWFRF